jgi:hypothetical protein
MRRWLARGAGPGDHATGAGSRAAISRGDAAFATPDVYESLEAEGYKYTIWQPANSVL